MPVTITRGLPNIATIVGQDSDPPPVSGMGKVNRTGQVANIGTTNFTDTRPTGVYFIRAILECTTIGTGTISFNVQWTDDVGSASLVIVSLVMTATGRSSGITSIYSASGNITYTVTGYVSGTYAVRARCFYGGA